MGFIEQRLPDLIALGAVAGPRFLTNVGESQSGYEQRKDLWTLERGQWDLSYANRNTAQTKALIAFFYCVAKGRVNGFRFYDRNAGEHQCFNEFIGTGDGIEDTFQLRKLYTVESETYERLVTKPVAGTLKITLDDSPDTAWTLDSTTGLVTFTAPPDADVVIRASFQFDVPVRFTVDWLKIQSIQPGIYSWSEVGLCEIRDIV